MHSPILRLAVAAVSFALMAGPAVSMAQTLQPAMDTLIETDGARDGLRTLVDAP